MSHPLLPIHPTESNSKSYFLDNDVSLYLENTIAHLLNFSQGQFYALDEMATLMLLLVLDKGFEATVTEISQTYEVTSEQVETDLNQLLQTLQQKKLITTTAQLENSEPHKIIQFINNTALKFLKSLIFLYRKIFNPQPSSNYLTVNLLLTLSWLSFRILGWGRTMSLWQQWHKQSDIIVDNNAQEILQHTDQIIRLAAASRLFLPMVCKERALVGYHLLHTFYTLPAELIIGIQKYSFQIHAWVECQGTIITDDPAHCEPFTPVKRYS